MKDLIPTIKITNYAGVSSIKDGMKSNAYSKVALSFLLTINLR